MLFFYYLYKTNTAYLLLNKDKHRMNFNTISDFFKKIRVNGYDGLLNYEFIKYMLSTLDAISRSSGQSLYVIDYCNRGFIYVSPSSLFLNGHTVDEVLKMGYLYYEKNLPPEDLSMLLEINNQGFDFFYNHPVEERLKFTISYDFRLIQSNNFKVMVNHKLTPIMLTPKGDIWLALCVVSLSTKDKPGNVFINKDGILHRYSYSFEGRRWKMDEIISLSSREREILQLSMQGMSNDQIADTVFIDLNTVKFHKKNIFKKLEVKNIAEAIIFAQNNNII